LPSWRITAGVVWKPPSSASNVRCTGRRRAARELQRGVELDDEREVPRRQPHVLARAEAAQVGSPSTRSTYVAQQRGGPADPLLGDRLGHVSA
jgi:hypothetical protein